MVDAPIIGRLALHPRRQDCLCVVSGRQVLVSFAADQDRAAVAAILQAQGYAVHSDCTVSGQRIVAGGV